MWWHFRKLSIWFFWDFSEGTYYKRNISGLWKIDGKKYASLKCDSQRELQTVNE